MEEDIKILEEIKKKFEKTMKIIVLGEYSTYVDNSIFEDIKKLINISENLLTRYKQLEEENNNMAEEYLVNNPGMAKYLNDNYIFKSKVKEKIEELDNERRKFTNDNVNNFYLQEFTRKYTQKSDHDYGVFGTPETITYCINNELLGRIEVLQELLREE